LDSFEIDALEHALTSSTRAVIVNSPVNPTGRILTSTEIMKLIELAHSRNFWIIFDQVYADLAFRRPVSYPQRQPGGLDRTWVVDSFSKSFGMTGWRLGYLATPPGLSASVVKFIQHSIYCVPAFIQAAGVQALELAEELVPTYRAMFRRRLELAVDRLAGVKGLACAIPDAGFFLFPRVEGDDIAIARRWLADLDVAVLPGSAFGAAGAGHLRISVSCRDDELDLALDRIARLGLHG
jgi:aspartate aminotransferase